MVIFEVYLGEALVIFMNALVMFKDILFMFRVLVRPRKLEKRDGLYVKSG